MREAVDQIDSSVERLSERVQLLEKRVAMLEGERATVTASQPAPLSLVSEMEPDAQSVQSWIGILGKAVLIMAGAYLFRALAESPAIPKWPVLAMAILYAAGWMTWAIRIHERTFASIAYGLTAVLIIAPLLWESTVRFQYLSPALTASILVAFFLMVIARSWRIDLVALPWATALAVVFTALGLLLVTRDLVPLTVALLVIAFIGEIAVGFGKHTTLRPLTAIYADLAVFLQAYVMTSSDVVPERYRPVSPYMVVTLSALLFLIGAGAIAVRGLWMRRRITVFDVIQGAIVSSIAIFTAVRTPLHFVTPVLGATFLLFAATCYWATFWRFHDDEDPRNRRVLSAWAAGLLAAGTLLLFPPLYQTPLLCSAAIATGIAYRRSGKLSLGLHASFLLATATIASGAIEYGTEAFAGDVPPAILWPAAIIAAAAVICYSLGAVSGESRATRRALWIFPAALAAFTGAALFVGGVALLSQGRWDLTPSRVSVIRTIAICTLAVVFGILGFRMRRSELTWLSYAAAGLGTLKLLLEDVRFGNPASLVLSFLFYGLLLIVLPRLSTTPSRTQAASSQ